MPHKVQPIEPDAPAEKEEKPTGKIRPFVRKYFLEGQKLEDDYAVQRTPAETADLPFFEKYRKFFGFAIPVAFVHLIWWTLAIRYNIFRLYPTRYELPVTMIVGATVAGATSEGGGAVAFPVMTLLLHIDPVVARDFSLMCQSTGMTAAAATIIIMKVAVEWHSVLFCSLGATVSIIVGLQSVDQFLDGTTKKMLFVSIWFSFAVALFILNRQKKRLTHLSIPEFGVWKASILFLTGFVGGLLSAFAGSGVDICSFSILTLLFRVSEKVATPTSVVLMAINTVVGFFWRELIMTDISQLAWEYFEVSVPVCAAFAPFGAFISSHFHRQTLAALIYLMETVALLGFLVTAPPVYMMAIGAGIIIFSFFFFTGLSHLGQRLNEDKEEECRQVVCDAKAAHAALDSM